MNSLIRRSTTPKGALIVSFALALLATAFFGLSQITHAVSDQPTPKGRLVTIYDRGNETVIVTGASTVGGALQQAGVSLASQDVVEPAASEKLVAGEYKVNIYRARPVIVVDGATRLKIMTPYQTPEQIAQVAGITLYPEDATTLSRIDDLSEGAGLQLTIVPATPINLDLYGQPNTIRTQAKTVADVLKEKAITLGPTDTVSLPLSTPVTSGMTIELWRNGTQTATVNEPISFDTQVIDDADQPVGYVSVQTAGVNGTKAVTYQIEMKNGVEVNRTQIQSVVITTPKQQVEVYGTKLVLSPGYSSQRIAIMSSAGIDPSDYGYVAYIIDHENGMWCPTRWQGQSVCTASYVALHVIDAQVGYGLCQATPGSKMASAGSDWQTNPVTQMKWCNSYALGRYGSWSAAYTHWVNNHNW